MLGAHLFRKKSVRPVPDILFKTFSGRKLSLSRCSPEIHQFPYRLIYYTFFFHLSTGGMMPELNESEKKNQNGGESGQGMPAEFGMPTAIFVVVAGMVGTGILTTSGYTVASVGSNGWMLLLWTIGGVTAVCAALTLAELTAALPKTGGDYVYLYEAYGPLPAFLSGWVSFLIGFAGPCAAAAFAFAQNIVAPIEGSGPTAILWERILATAAIVIFALIHVSGRRGTAQAQAWVTLLKLCVLTAFACAGVSIGWPNRANLADLTPVDETLLANLMSSMVYIYYAYTGWNSASFLAGEIRDPQRCLPPAILIGTAGVTVLYLALNMVYALAISATDVRAMVDDPSNHIGEEAVAPIALIAAGRLFGTRWSAGFSIGIGLMLLSTMSAYLLIGPRVVFAMAQAGQLPKVAARLTRRAGTPTIATILQVCVALVLLWTGTSQSIIIYASVGLSIFSMLAMSSIYVLRWRRPDLPRPFRTPGYPLTPAVYLVTTAVLTVAVFLKQPRISSYALLSIGAGIPFYYVWRAGVRWSTMTNRGIA
jgi:APA family basic amino acid/polyamine antiporter